MLRDVTARQDEKSFGFGVLANETDAGYMTAERIFGRDIPTALTLRFTTSDGVEKRQNVIFPQNNRSRRLRLIIDGQLNVTGVYE